MLNNAVKSVSQELCEAILKITLFYLQFRKIGYEE